MSNVALFGNNTAVALPSHLIGRAVSEATKKLAGGSGGLRISIKGSVWRMIDNGEEIGTREERYLNAVIVASSPDTARTFYTGTYVEGETTAPTCWSADGKAPDAEVEFKQAVTCAVCPQNVAGSGQGDSRACRFSRNLAVVLDNDLGGKVFKLSLPAQSIFGKVENGVQPLQAYAKQLIAHGVDANAVVTEMRFDTTSATPKVGFKAVRFLTKEEFDVAIAQGATPEALDAIKTTVFQQDGGVARKGPEPLQIAGTNPVAQEAQPATIGNTATVAAQPAPATPAKRTRAKPAPVAEAATPVVQQPVPAAVDGTGAMTQEQMMAQLAQLQAMLAAQQATATAAQQPVVVAQQTPSAAPVPAGVADVLSAWGDSDE